MKNETIILELSNWWGLRNPGSQNYMITDDKKIYYQKKYYRTSEIEERLIKELSDQEYQEIIKFIQDNIENKNFENHMIFDASYDVYVNYNNKVYRISNNITYDNEEGIYNKTKKLIERLIGE